MNRLIGSFFGMLATVIPLSAAAVDGNNWMTAINDSAPLSQLTIPGTHDSAATYWGYGGIGQCQSANIDSQLAMGVRYFDLRCHYEGHGGTNSLSIHHGILFQHCYLDDCLAACYRFLAANPGEVVLVQIKEENSHAGATFADTISWYLQQNPGKWYSGTTIPSLHDVRGKCVLIRRYGPESTGGTPGIDASSWADDRTFTCGKLTVQDHYNINSSNTASNKWNDILGQMNQARNSTNLGQLFINFTTGATATGIIASTINPMLRSAMPAWGPNRYGAILMDYVDSDLATKCYRLNFGAFSNGVCQFLNDNSGKALEIGGLAITNGAPADQCVNVHALQQSWSLYQLGGGLYEIRNNYTAKALDLAGGSTADGAPIGQSDFVNSINQKWFLVPNSDGTCRIVNRGTCKVVEIGGSSHTDAAPAQQSDWTGAANQKWTFSSGY